MQQRFLLAVAFPLAVALAGCAGDSANVPDATRPDGPAAGDAPPPDAAPDSAGVERNDAEPLPDASVRGDSASSADLRVTDLAADNAPVPDLAADNAPAPDLAADSVPAPDSTGDRGADRPTADGAERDATGDVGCTGWTTLERLAPAAAKALIEESDPIVINVHYPYEGDIPGTDATIPFDDVDAIEAYLNHDHCAEVLLFCRSDSMSKTAGDALIKRGYLRVRDLKGGMIAWVAAGYPLLKDGGP